MYHLRPLSLGKPNFSVTSAGLKACGKSCLFASTCEEKVRNVTQILAPDLKIGHWPYQNSLNHSTKYMCTYPPRIVVVLLFGLTAHQEHRVPQFVLPEHSGKLIFRLGHSLP